jgi:hypothetical protein
VDWATKPAGWDGDNNELEKETNYPFGLPFVPFPNSLLSGLKKNHLSPKERHGQKTGRGPAWKVHTGSAT